MTWLLMYIDLGLAFCLWAMELGDGLERMEESEREASRRGIAADSLDRSRVAVRWVVAMISRPSSTRVLRS